MQVCGIYRTGKAAPCRSGWLSGLSLAIAVCVGMPAAALAGSAQDLFRTAADQTAKLNAQLEQAAKDYVNSRRGVRFDNGAPVVSSIYVWYIDDFGGTDQGVLEHLRKYAAPDWKSAWPV